MKGQVGVYKRGGREWTGPFTDLEVCWERESVGIISQAWCAGKTAVSYIAPGRSFVDLVSLPTGADAF